MGLIIDAERLRRSFGGQTAVPAGEVFELLGQNGGGKTTTIRMSATLLPPSSGTARVCGFDVVRAAGDVRLRIGYVMQQVSPWAPAC